MITRKDIYYTVNDTLYGLNESTLKNTSIRLNLVANPKQLSEQIYNKFQPDEEIINSVKLSEAAKQTLIKLELFEELNLEGSKEYNDFIFETANKILDFKTVITEGMEPYYGTVNGTVNAGARNVEKNVDKNETGNPTAGEVAASIGITAGISAAEAKIIEKKAYNAAFKKAINKGLTKEAAQAEAKAWSKKFLERKIQHMAGGAVSKTMFNSGAGKAITKTITSKILSTFGKFGIQCGSKATLAICTLGVSLAIEAVLLAISTGGINMVLKSKKLVGFLYKYCIKQKWSELPKSKPTGFLSKLGFGLKTLLMKLAKVTYTLFAFFLYGDTTIRITKAAVKYGIADQEDVEKYKNDTDTSFMKNNAITQIANAKQQQQQNQQQQDLNANNSKNNNNIEQYAA